MYQKTKANNVKSTFTITESSHKKSQEAKIIVAADVGRFFELKTIAMSSFS